jgi:hypothetical protein
VIDRERQVGGERLADRFAVVPRIGGREQLEVLLHAIGDAVEDDGAFGCARAAPLVLRGVRGVERGLDVAGIRTGHLTQFEAVDRRGVVEVPAGEWRRPLPADEIVVACVVRSLLRACRLDRIENIGHGYLPA